MKPIAEALLTTGATRKTLTTAVRLLKSLEDERFRGSIDYLNKFIRSFFEIEAILNQYQPLDETLIFPHDIKIALDQIMEHLLDIRERGITLIQTLTSVEADSGSPELESKRSRRDHRKKGVGDRPAVFSPKENYGFESTQKDLQRCYAVFVNTLEHYPKNARWLLLCKISPSAACFWAKFLRENRVSIEDFSAALFSMFPDDTEEQGDDYLLFGFRENFVQSYIHRKIACSKEDVSVLSFNKFLILQQKNYTKQLERESLDRASGAKLFPRHDAGVITFSFHISPLVLSTFPRTIQSVGLCMDFESSMTTRQVALTEMNRKRGILLSGFTFDLNGLCSSDLKRAPFKIQVSLDNLNGVKSTSNANLSIKDVFESSKRETFPSSFPTSSRQNFFATLFPFVIPWGQQEIVIDTHVIYQPLSFEKLNFRSILYMALSKNNEQDDRNQSFATTHSGLSSFSSSADDLDISTNTREHSQSHCDPFFSSADDHRCTSNSPRSHCDPFFSSAEDHRLTRSLSPCNSPLSHCDPFLSSAEGFRCSSSPVLDPACASVFSENKSKRKHNRPRTHSDPSRSLSQKSTTERKRTISSNNVSSHHDPFFSSARDHSTKNMINTAFSGVEGKETGSVHPFTITGVGGLGVKGLEPLPTFSSYLALQGTVPPPGFSFSSLSPSIVGVADISPASTMSSYAHSPFDPVPEDEFVEEKHHLPFEDEKKFSSHCYSPSSNSLEIEEIIKKFQSQAENFPGEVNILAVGGSGAGKSSTLNLIFGSETFPAGHSLLSVTQKLESRAKQVGPITLNLWDTRGFGADYKDNDILAELKEVITKKEIHALLFFFHGDRFSASVRKNLKRLKKIQPALMSRMIFVITHAADLPASDHQGWGQHYKEKKEQIRNAIYEVVGVRPPICLVETRNPILPDGQDCLTVLVTTLFQTLGNQRAMAAAIFMNTSKPGVANSLRRLFREFFDHPLTGAVMGAVVGGLVGSVSGPVGTAVGACVGAAFAGTYGATHPYFYRKQRQAMQRPKHHRHYRK